MEGVETIMVMPFLESQSNWRETLTSLHRAARVLATVHRLTRDPLPNYLELALHVTPTGLATAGLPRGGQAALDFTQPALVYTPAHGDAQRFPLQGHSQASLFAAFFGALRAADLAEVLRAGGDVSQAVLATLATRGRRKTPALETLFDATPLVINPQAAADYAVIVYSMFTALARFRARLFGPVTPLVMWAEHFDLSTLWFPGAQADEWQPHLNFGFAPYSPGIEAPYLYAYAYPYPARFDPPRLPAGADWHTSGWTGVVLPYAVIAAQPDAEGFVEASCGVIFDALRPLLGGVR
jgi:hypothetical protein